LPGGSIGVGYDPAIGEVRLLEAVPFVIAEGVGDAVTEPDTGLVAQEVIAVLLVGIIGPYLPGLTTQRIIFEPGGVLVRIQNCFEVNCN
jgi:hypothetical protein